jgi:outer membrane protein
MNKLTNISLAINAVLAIAVGVLYYLHFAGTGGGGNLSDSMKKSPIVFVDSDSLLSNFNLYKTKMSELSAKKSALEAQFTGQAQQLETDIAVYQRTQSSFSIDTRIAKEKDLSARQQGIMVLREQLTGQLEEAEAKASEEVREAITTYLKQLSKKTNFQYVLGASKNSGVLYASDSLNVTGPVLKGLNDVYPSEATGTSGTGGFNPLGGQKK